MEFNAATLRPEPEDGPSSDETVDVGTRIARLRARNGWTLQETARRTGVAFSTLSKIERQDLSPTVTTLTKIARGMGLTLSQLLEAPRPVVGVARRSIARGAEGRVSATSTCDNMILCSDLTNRKMTPIRTRVRARDLTVYEEWASYDAEIFLTVLSGTLVIHSQSYVPTRLTAGDSIYYDASARHLWTSEGEDDAVVLWVYAE
ncbi:helix-turn-helix domain-containing protein [Frigidibacter sp.]|uniref:helix-turn-helix domain-containing protein n=1 Tax=Frigidibacter sp. TaxID=2586418 RepID=UPI002736D581|nr:XRE family transcriptional regulator [Frigidibacter sp.]MDP3342183.1 XRE family transcriptional regulator [Frigidibacter sp.]